MRPSNASRAVRNLCHLWSGWILAVLALSSSNVSTANPVLAAVPASYRVLQLSRDSYAYGIDINASGQVAFTEHVGNAVRARFYDGQTLRTLGTFGGPNAATAALNDMGQVIGNADLSQDGTLSHAYRWSHATGMVDLDAGTRAGSKAAAINERGQVAGAGWVAIAGGLQYRAYLWSPQGGKTYVGAFGMSSVATALNDTGTVTGYAEGPEGGPRSILAFRWTRREGIRAIGALPDEFTWATGINEAGQIVGATPFAPEQRPHAFVWTPRQGLRDLGTGTGERSSATKITDDGVVIGDIISFGTLYHGFVWTRSTGMIEFAAGQPGIETFTTDVNRAGQVVGGFGGRAFLWTRPQGVVDLNTRLSRAPRSLVLSAGQAISDNGAIVASSSSGLYLLIPRR